MEVESFNKIFGVGYSKTGTTSLTRALNLLGLNAQHFPFHALDHRSDTLTLIPKRLWRQGYTDTPIPLFYQELDRLFPGSKFILTLRRSGEWLSSCEKNHVWPGDHVHDKAVRNLRYVRTLLNTHYELYGSVTFNPDTFLESYERHNEQVIEYFKGREEDLLIIDICGGEGWEKLCPFLGIDTVQGPFPRANVGVDKYFKRESRRQFWKWISAMHLGARLPQKYKPKAIASNVAKS